MAQKDFADLIEEVAHRFGEYRKGTVSSDSSTTTLVDQDNLYEADDYWVGHYLYMLSGDASGTERPITDYDQGDGKMTVSPAFASSISSTDTYEILPLRRDQIKKAINAAIRAVGTSWPVTKKDSTTITSLASTSHEYSLPSDLVNLLNVGVRSASDEGWVSVPTQLWVVAGTYASQYVRFSEQFGIPHGMSVQLDYLARPSTLSSDSDTLDIGEPGEREAVDFVVNYALFWLHDMQASAEPTGAGFRPHLTQAQYYRELAESLRARASQWPPTRGEQEEE